MPDPACHSGSARPRYRWRVETFDDPRCSIYALVAKPHAFAANGMLAAIGIYDALGVETHVKNDDAVIEYFNLAQIMRRGQDGDQAVSAADRGRIVDG